MDPSSPNRLTQMGVTRRSGRGSQHATGEFCNFGRLGSGEDDGTMTGAFVANKKGIEVSPIPYGSQNAPTLGDHVRTVGTAVVAVGGHIS